MLRLSVDAIVSGLHWRWRLLDDSDEVLAAHAVELSAAELSTTKVLDLYRSLWRLDTDPAWRPESERAILEPLGDFIAERLLGPIAEVLANRAPVTVQIVSGNNAAAVVAFPLELARHQGRSLFSAGVTWSYATQPAGSVKASTVTEESPRVLAVFALPVDTSALSLVRERREIVRLMSSLGASQRLTVLQYGVTRAALAAALADPQGWDLIHISGHGVAGALYFEDGRGDRDLIDAPAIVDLLAPAAHRTRLVMLSVCESAAARAARQGRIVGQTELLTRPSVAIQSVGFRVAADLGCAVIAMRYPVEDRFSVAFSRALYESLFGHGAALDEAFHAATVEAARATPHSPLTAATPVLISDRPHDQLAPARRAPSVADLDVADGIPSEAPFFVGRSAALAAIADVLKPGAASGGLVIVGMPEVGKTAAAVESIQIHGASFDRTVWHQMAPTDDITEVLEALNAPSSLSGAAAADWVRERRLLIVVDDAHAALTDAGRWRSMELGTFFDAVAEPGGPARLMLISQRRLPVTEQVARLALPMLSMPETRLLVYELAESHGTSESVTIPVHRVCRGHPGLIIKLHSGAPEDLRPAIDRLAWLWDAYAPPSPKTIAVRAPLADDHIGSRVQAWARARVAELSDDASILLSVLSVMEHADRHLPVLEVIWQMIAEHVGADQHFAPAAIVEELSAVGLVTLAGDDVLVLPVVAATVRRARPDVDAVATESMVVWWQHGLQQGPGAGVGPDWLAHGHASIVPYLMRVGAWEAASENAELAIHLDTSPDMAGRLRPYVGEIVRATADSDLRLTTRCVEAALIAGLDPGQGRTVMTELYREAEQCDDSAVMLYTGAAIADSMVLSNPGKARDWLLQAIARQDQHPVNPLVAILLRLKVAKLERDFGVDPQTSAAVADELTAELQDLIDDCMPLHGAHLPSVLAELADFASSVKRRVAPRRPSGSIDGLVLDPATTSQRDMIRAQFNFYAAGAEHPSTQYTAEEMLAAILSHYGEQADQAKRGLVLGVLAEMRWREGNVAEAREFGRRALRADHAARASSQAAFDHRQLATIEAGQENYQAAALHLLAAAVIYVRSSQGRFVFIPDHHVLGALWAVKMLIARMPEGIPSSYDDMRTQITADIGCDIEDLLSECQRMPVIIDGTGRITMSWAVADSSGTLADVLDLASVDPPVSELNDPNLVTDHWGTLVDLVVEAAHGRADAEPTLATIEAAGWAPLAEALRGVIAGADDGAPADAPAVDARIVGLAIAKIKDSQGSS